MNYSTFGLIFYLLIDFFSDGAHRPVVRLIRPRGLRHDAGLSGGEEVPGRGYNPELQGQVPAQG